MPRWLKIACVISMFCSYAAILIWMAASLIMFVVVPQWFAGAISYETSLAIAAFMLSTFAASAVLGYGPGIIVWFFERRSAKPTIAQL